jgi:hypothetical protein
MSKFLIKQILREGNGLDVKMQKKVKMSNMHLKHYAIMLGLLKRKELCVSNYATKS